MSYKDFLSNKRYSQIFKELVEEYVETGEPVGSRTLSKRMDNSLSPATIRNVMADLEELGVLCSEHTSSGRKPTEKGWRYFVNTFIEVSSDFQDDYIKHMLDIGGHDDHNSAEVLEKISEMLSHLSSCASVILAPIMNCKIVRHIEFMLMSPEKALVIIVMDDGSVENRIICVPYNIKQYNLIRATNYLNTKICGMTLSEIKDFIDDAINTAKDGLNTTENEVIINGIEALSDNNDKIIVKGYSHLLSNMEEIDNVKGLFDKLDEKQMIKSLLDEAIRGQGIKIFIGSESKIFDLAGCSMIVSPYSNSKKKIVGAIGVIGPERMRYNKLVNLIDCTARMLEKLI